MSQKTNADRIIRIVDLAEKHYGKEEVVSVGVKFEVFSNTWIAELITEKHFFSESGDTVEVAVKGLKNRIKRVIERYQKL